MLHKALCDRSLSPCPLHRQKPQKHGSSSHCGHGVRPWALKTASQMGCPKCVSGKEKYQQQSHHHHQKSPNQPKSVGACGFSSTSSVFLLVSNSSAHLSFLLCCCSFCFCCFIAGPPETMEFENWMFGAACVRWKAAGTTKAMPSKMGGRGKDFVKQRNVTREEEQNL